MFTLAFDLPRTMRERIWLTTVEALRTQPAETPLGAPLWVRPRDARSWLLSLRPRLNENGLRGFAARKKFLSERLAQLPRHSLLPQPPHVNWDVPVRLHC